MRAVRLNREQLLEILRENQKKHLLDYEASVLDFKSAVLKLAQANVKLAKTGALDEIAKMKRVPTAPVSYAESYSRAIRMLELSVDDIIELDDAKFAQLVQDEWQWKHEFQVASALYKSL